MDSSRVFILSYEEIILFELCFSLIISIFGYFLSDFEKVGLFKIPEGGLAIEKKGF